MRINSNNFKQRKLPKCLPHFACSVLTVTDSRIPKINEWIYENCRGRYSITKDVKTVNGKGIVGIKVGFEEPSDLTLFALSGLMA